MPFSGNLQRDGLPRRKQSTHHATFLSQPSANSWRSLQHDDPLHHTQSKRRQTLTRSIVARSDTALPGARIRRTRSSDLDNLRQSHQHSFAKADCCRECAAFGQACDRTTMPRPRSQPAMTAAMTTTRTWTFRHYHRRQLSTEKHGSTARAFVA